MSPPIAQFALATAILPVARIVNGAFKLLGVEICSGVQPAKISIIRNCDNYRPLGVGSSRSASCSASVLGALILAISGAQVVLGAMDGEKW
jgi:hypothetical protein